MQTDSLQYRFSFALETLAQVPGEFVLPAGVGELQTGVFLPGDDADWLGRRRYLPHVLLLCGRELLMMPHPSSAEQPVRVPLDAIAQIEWGRILLTGWIVLKWDGGRLHLPYNTRSRAPVERAVKAILECWLPAATAQRQSAACFGPPLDIKFTNALSAELIAQEAIVAQLYQPADRSLRRRFWFQGGTTTAGDLLLLTSRRILWITERHKGKYGRYGAVSHTARLSSVARCAIAGQSSDIEIQFSRGESWRIPLREAWGPAARDFVGQAIVGCGLPS